MWPNECDVHRGQKLPCVECRHDSEVTFQVFLLLVFAVVLAIVGAVILGRMEDNHAWRTRQGDRRGTHSGGGDAGRAQGDGGW